MRRATKGRGEAPLIAHRQERLKGGPVFRPEAELRINLSFRQLEAKEGGIRLGFAAIRAGKTSARPDPARLCQFPRFAPIIAEL